MNYYFWIISFLDGPDFRLYHGTDEVVPTSKRMLEELPRDLWLKLTSGSKKVEKWPDQLDVFKARFVSDRLRQVIAANCSYAKFVSVPVRDKAGSLLSGRYYLLIPSFLDCVDSRRTVPREPLGPILCPGRLPKEGGVYNLFTDFEETIASENIVRIIDSERLKTGVFQLARQAHEAELEDG